MKRRVPEPQGDAETRAVAAVRVWHSARERSDGRGNIVGPLPVPELPDIRGRAPQGTTMAQVVSDMARAEPERIYAAVRRAFEADGRLDHFDAAVAARVERDIHGPRRQHVG